MPSGGQRSSLAGLVSALTAPFRRPSQGDPSKGRGAPIYSYTLGQSGIAGPGPGNTPDITQFRDVFQPNQGIFSPNYPLVPVEREQLRTWNFPQGYNLSYTPRSYEAIGCQELRSLAEHEDLTRMAIETRKEQVEKLDWTIRSRDEDDVASDADNRIKAMTEFWASPDGWQPFASWIRQALEDVLVLDAPAFEVRRNRVGDIIGLDVVDGGTFKVLIDHTGRRPQPPAPAFEQIIQGRPWVLAEDGSRVNTEEHGKPFFDSQIIYLPRNPRPHKPYGFSPVEQIVVTINTALRRELMQLQRFTEGNVPPGMINGPEGWQPDQIKQFQDWFDSVLAGNTASRTRLIWGPAGSRYQPFTESPYKDGFDEWLARKVCFAFSLPPTPFMAQVNRATAETAQEAALEEGLAPLMGWVKRLCDGVIQKRFGHKDLEFAWATDQEQMPPETQATMLIGLVKDGIITRNEARNERGMDPEAGGELLTVDTASGPVLVSHIAQISEQQANPPEPPPVQPGVNVDNGVPPGERPEPGTQSSGRAPADRGEQQPAEKREVAKAGDIPFARRARQRHNHALLAATRTKLQQKLQHFFAAEASAVAAQLAPKLELAKADQTDDERRRRERAAALLAALALGDWAGLAPDVAGDLAPIYAGGLGAAGFRDGARTRNEARANLGLPPVEGGDEVPDILDQIDGRAEAWASKEADDLVSGLKDRTPGMLETTVVAALAGGWSAAQLAQEIAGSPAFSEARAEMITHNETTVAERQGLRLAMQHTRVTNGKRWITAGDLAVTWDCLENEAAGVIPIDQEWPNGSYPHIGCRCREELADL